TYPTFNKFIDQECMPELIEGLDIPNKGSIVMKSQTWLENQQKMQEMAAQNAPIDPIKAQMQIEAAKIQQKNQEMQINAAVQSAKIQQDNRKVDMELIKTLSSVKSNEAAQLASKQKAQSENVRSAALLATQLAKHSSDIRQNHHKMIKEDMKKAMEIINKPKIDDEDSNEIQYS